MCKDKKRNTRYILGQRKEFRLYKEIKVLNISQNTFPYFLKISSYLFKHPDFVHF